MLNFDPLDPKESTSENKPSLPSNKTNSHHYYQGNASSNSRFFKRISIATAIAGVGIASYAAYQQRLQTETAIIQAQAAVEQIDDFAQQNDLEEVSQGLMTKEQYLKKYKR